MKTLIQWVTEQWFHAHPFPEGPAPTVIDVVVPRQWVAEVIAEAERYTRDAAAAAAVTV